MIISAIIGLVFACAFFYYENARQKVLNEQLQNRLGIIETQLGVSNNAGNTSESIANKVEDINKDLKNTNDEIRKLWNITNDKNKKMLDIHEAKIVEQGKSIDSLQGTTTELKKISAQTEKSTGEASRLAAESNQTANEAAKALADMRSSVGTIQQRLAQGDPQVREALQQATMAQEQSEQLQTKIDALTKRTSEHEDSLRSIDSFRRSVSNDVSKLKQLSFPQDGSPNTGNGR
jgi:chromosome segregation ATPase